MKILITGGAGYIGSTVAWMFLDKGHEVTIIDNLSRGSLFNIPKNSKFIKSDISNISLLKKTLEKNYYDIVLHFAAYTDNKESISKKKLYFKNNYYKSKIFFQICIEKNIKNFIFSSSAAIYGLSNIKVDEDLKPRPLAPYGKSKLKFENYLTNSKKNINFVIIRYFNVVGVEKKMRCGFGKNNKNLIYNLCESHFKKKEFSIFGKNFKTKDGTAVRDYIHVGDLSKVHYQFAKIMNKSKLKLIVNCGYGKGYSVLEVANKFNEAIKKKIAIKFKDPRKNEMGYSCADTKKLKKFYNFKNVNSKLSLMINSSLIWYKKISNKIAK
jgi:UDP-glucose 4-epimerase